MCCSAHMHVHVVRVVYFLKTLCGTCMLQEDRWYRARHGCDARPDADLPGGARGLPEHPRSGGPARTHGVPVRPGHGSQHAGATRGLPEVCDSEAFCRYPRGLSSTGFQPGGAQPCQRIRRPAPDVPLVTGRDGQGLTGGPPHHLLKGLWTAGHCYAALLRAVACRRGEGPGLLRAGLEEHAGLLAEGQLRPGLAPGEGAGGHSGSGRGRAPPGAVRTLAS